MKILMGNNNSSINLTTNSLIKSRGSQSIHLACKNGDINTVKVLIDNKCDINVYDDNGYQPIHLACLFGHINIVKILIDNKCDMQALTKDEKSPIDIARQKDYQEIIEIINSHLNSANSIELIATAMNLDCKKYCDHRFCLKTLHQDNLPRGESIGSGSFGEIYKYQISNSNRKFVIKQTSDVGEDKKNIERNINKFSTEIIHRNIVRYFGTLEKSGKLYIFMEYIPGGSIKDQIDKIGMIEINNVIQYSLQLLSGLKFLHSKAIIHRDIKPGNILLDHSETIKLSDFGISRSLEKSFSESTDKADTFCGTPNYMAPEIFMGESYDFSADIWSTGATVIHMITGKMPYHNLRPEAVIFRIGTTRKIEFTSNQPISKIMQSFINDLLTPDQLKRPTATKLLNHSIFH